VSVSTGRSYPLKNITANVGRRTQGVRAVQHQVVLPEQRISRIHLGISNKGVVTDWRSFYGTTRNGEWLRYGDSRDLSDGDILVLSGLEVLKYRTIEWRPWHYLREPVLGEEGPAPGWAVLVDGRHRTTVPIRSDQAFVTIRDGAIDLSDQPTGDAVVAVRRHVFHNNAPLAGRAIRALKFEDEDKVAVKYFAAVLDPERDGCPVRNEVSVLTLQLLPGAKGDRITGSIKEGDYHRRDIVLPSDSETAVIAEGQEFHGLGEIIFETEVGPFQIVPTHTADVGEICDSDR
jgi:pSer/pThr/pTyr-binding forkhead associated (FHA) protein